MKKQQFTLIEMLVVIAIISVLATMIGSAVFGVREKANRTACLNNLKQLYTATNSYKDSQGGFPFIDSGTLTTGGKNHEKLLFLIRKTEAGSNPSLYICPSASNVIAGPDKAAVDLTQTSDFKDTNNSYAYHMGDVATGATGTSMKTTSGILSDGFRGTGTPTKASDDGWNHDGAGQIVFVDSSGKQVEDDNWPNQVKGPEAAWNAFIL